MLKSLIEYFREAHQQACKLTSFFREQMDTVLPLAKSWVLHLITQVCSIQQNGIEVHQAFGRGRGSSG